MKYILGFIVILGIIFGGYSLIGNSAQLQEAGEQQASNTETQEGAVAPPVKAILEDEVETINNTIKENTMTESNNTITKATFKTNQGDITIEFYTDDAPKTVANFVKLASEGFYDGVKFHRVIKGFMIQGGDPLSKKEGAAWGTGGPGYTFEDEIHANNRNDKYTLAMANAGPNTNGSQFFINTNDNNFLDTKHTVFGKVIAGTETVDAIENTPTGAQDRPVEPMVIESIVLE